MNEMAVFHGIISQMAEIIELAAPMIMHDMCGSSLVPIFSVAGNCRKMRWNWDCEIMLSPKIFVAKIVFADHFLEPGFLMLRTF